MTGERVFVEVEGIKHVVKTMKASNSYLAHETPPWGGLIDPNYYRKNVLAIEKVTGCIVDRVTIMNQGLATYAAVVCDQEND